MGVRRKPKYLEISESIHRSLERGTPGQRIETVDVLTGVYKVSNRTILRALGVLEEKGILSVKPGHGTVYLGPLEERIATPDEVRAFGGDPSKEAFRVKVYRRGDHLIIHR